MSCVWWELHRGGFYWRCLQKWLWCDKKIFKKQFCIPDKEEEDPYPLFTVDLLGYLSNCPLGDKSNSVAAIAFLVNHSTFTFMDRIGQCTTLDSMIDGLSEF